MPWWWWQQRWWWWPGQSAGQPLFFQKLSFASPAINHNISTVNFSIQPLHHHHHHDGHTQSLVASKTASQVATEWTPIISRSYQKQEDDDHDEKCNLWELFHQLIEAGVLPTKQSWPRHSHLTQIIYEDPLVPTSDHDGMKIELRNWDEKNGAGSHLQRRAQQCPVPWGPASAASCTGKSLNKISQVKNANWGDSLWYLPVAMCTFYN